MMNLAHLKELMRVKIVEGVQFVTPPPCFDPAWSYYFILLHLQLTMLLVNC